MSLINDCAFVSDLHLTNNERDEYRWDFLNVLRETCLEHKLTRLFVLGDLTDAKDFHSSKLVNRVVEAFTSFTDNGIEVWILRGNHDGLDPNCPYFKFLSRVKGITFVYEPGIYDDVLMLPHSRTPEVEWSAWDFKGVPYIFLHATMDGSLSESGMAMRGVPPAMFNEATGKIFSGDIHVPQTCGKVEYVGSPYHVHFGDKFKPRIIWFRNGKRQQDIYPRTQRRLVVDLNGPEELKTTTAIAGDQIKVRLHLTQSEVLDWDRMRKRVMVIASEMQLQLCGLELEIEKKSSLREAKPSEVAHVSPAQLLTKFCEREKLDKPLIDLGTALLKESGV